MRTRMTALVPLPPPLAFSRIGTCNITTDVDVWYVCVCVCARVCMGVWECVGMYVYRKPVCKDWRMFLFGFGFQILLFGGADTKLTTLRYYMYLT